MCTVRTLILLLLMGGCASSRPDLVNYNASTGETTFVSKKALVGNISMTGGLASGQRVMMQAIASCPGQDCTPDEVDLVFLNDSSSDLNLDYRRIQIVYGGKTIDWEDTSRLHEPEHYVTPRGEFIRVPVSRSDFAAMASATNVEVSFGRTGTTLLRMSSSNRAPLRDLAEAMTAR